MWRSALALRKDLMKTTLTRRALLQTAGGLAAAAAFPRRATAPVIERLSAYMAAAAARDLPRDVVEKTKHHILDTLAAMVSGSTLAPGRVAIALARAHAGERVATVAGCDALCGPIEAALAN